MKLENKVALITGAASGIGRAAAILFAREGAKVGALDYNEDGARRTVAEIEDKGGEAITLVADISQPDQMREAVDTLARAWGRIEIVFANAGINGVWAPIDELEPEEWDRTFDINLKGTFLTFKYTVPYLRAQGGSAVITSSLHGTRVFTIPGSTAYACTKAAQVAFAKKIALELARDKVRVNVICPGSTDTRINDTVEKRGIERIRLPIEFPEGKMLLTGGRKASPEDIARLALFLASDDAAVITGTEVWIDGGMSLMMG